MARFLPLLLLALPLAAGADAPARPTVGAPAPAFTVKVRDGEGLKDLKLADFRGKSHLVIVFGRAHW